MHFTKMHGIGNDYIYVNGFKEEVNYDPEYITMISDRHKGIGSDGMIVLLPSSICDFKMRMFNNDGSEGKMCGNGIRCLAKFAYDEGMTTSSHITFETLGGIKVVDLIFDKNEVVGAVVDMGEPILTTKDIPVLYDKDQLINETINIADDDYVVSCISMGNPHCVTYYPNVRDMDITIGKNFEKHPMFPESVNTEFVEIIEDGHVFMRVYERGSGETMACGTGACAVAVNYMLGHPTCKHVIVDLLGGSLEITWLENNHIMMKGGATTVFKGNL